MNTVKYVREYHKYKTATFVNNATIISKASREDKEVLGEMPGT